MTLDADGIEELKILEGWRSRPYIDQAGVPTIGFGFTYYPDTGERVTMDDKPLSPERGREILKAMLVRYEAAVNSLVTQPLTQSQFNALVSFCYNVGPGAFSRSTLLKVINRDPCDYPAIKYQLFRWNKAGGKKSNGLIFRRGVEYNRYTNENYG